MIDYGEDKKLRALVSFIKRVAPNVYPETIDDVVGLLDDYRWNLEEAVKAYLSTNYGDNYRNHTDYIKFMKEQEDLFRDYKSPLIKNTILDSNPYQKPEPFQAYQNPCPL